MQRVLDTANSAFLCAFRGQKTLKTPKYLGKIYKIVSYD